jgi:hypothetical protein
MKEKKQTNDETSSDITYHEMNILKMPLFHLDTKSTGKHGIITVRIKTKNGVGIWQVSSNIKYGLGGPFDDAVLMTLGKIISNMPKPVENPIDIGSLKNIARIMGYTDPGGRGISKIKTSIKRFTSLLIESEFSFFDKSSKKYLDKIEGTFHLLDKAIFVNDVIDSNESDRNLIWLNDTILKNINSGYICPVKLDLYFKLKNVSARALIKILTESFYAAIHYPVCYRYSTICERSTLKKRKHLSLAKQQLDLSHDELVKEGFLEKYGWDNIKGVKDDWYIRYWPGYLAQQKQGKQTATTIQQFPNRKLLTTTENKDKNESNEIVLGELEKDKAYAILMELIPKDHQDKTTILEAISNAFRKHGFDYVKRNIEYTNKHCKNNYRAYLNKALKEDFGLALQEDQDARQKQAEYEKDLKKQYDAYILNKVEEYKKENLSEENLADLYRRIAKYYERDNNSLSEEAIIRKTNYYLAQQIGLPLFDEWNKSCL